MDRVWFEMPAIRRRTLANTVWVPLRQSEAVSTVGEKWHQGYHEDLACAGAIAFPTQQRALAETLGWHDLGLPQTIAHAFDDGGYKAVDVYQYRDGEDAGLHLVLSHQVADVPAQWTLNQDLVSALGLVQEGNFWVRPYEGFVEVARQRYNPDGSPAAIEIRSEFLRDYLAARGLSLRVATYRRRMAIFENGDHLPDWRNEPIRQESQHERFQTRLFDIAADGGLLGSVGVFRAWRTDVDPTDDVPVMGPETSENTLSSQELYVRQGSTLVRVEGEFWRQEWVEAADRSERVRGDSPLDEVHYITDANGARRSGLELANEDIGRWLWFKPDIVPALLQIRGAALEWYTHDTGVVYASYGEPVHFGINASGLVNVYARDVARLPMWLQRMWVSHSVTPSGSLSEELHASQVLAQPATTTAPEEDFEESWRGADSLCASWTGAPLFRVHESTPAILASIHRFRAIDELGLLRLAKDVARITADLIELSPLRSIAPPPRGQQYGSLKQLEKALATISELDIARSALTPLVGIYELRLSDAHLPSRQIQEAFCLSSIDRNAPPLTQGAQLIAAAARGFLSVGKIITEYQSRA